MQRGLGFGLFCHFVYAFILIYLGAIIPDQGAMMPYPSYGLQRQDLCVMLEFRGLNAKEKKLLVRQTVLLEKPDIIFFSRNQTGSS